MEMTMPMQADPLETALQHQLRRGERVLWQGRQLARLSPRMFGNWFFAIPWTGFALFWSFMAWIGAGQANDGSMGGQVAAIMFPLFGLPFVLIGCWMLAAPFLARANAANTIFAVTDQRVLRLYLGSRLKVDSLEADKIGTLSRSESADGSGTLTIAGSGRRKGFAIGDVADVRQADASVRQLIERAERADKLSS
jgi:hypothetical protein